MAASAAVTAAAAMGTATATVAAAADLSLVMNLIIYNIPYSQTDTAKYNNCRNYCCHDLIPFLFHNTESTGLPDLYSVSYFLCLPFRFYYISRTAFIPAPKLLRG